MAATASFRVRFDKAIDADEKALLIDGADWLRTHDGKVEDWEIDANPIDMEKLAILYLRAEVQRGNDFEYIQSVGQSAQRYGVISRPQARGLLNCMRANVLRKASLATEQAAPEHKHDTEAATAELPQTMSEKLPRGIFTVIRSDDSHRTYRITVPEWGDFRDGRVQVSLLTGPQNTSDYQGVAFLFPNHRVAIWKRYQESAENLRQDILALVDPESAEAAGKRYAMESGNCYKCNRTLTTPESIEAGIGPVCAGRL